jgi:hypothetical protein
LQKTKDLKMVKLQLYITKSLRGFKSLVNLNPADDISRYVIDVSTALNAVNYDATEKNIFYYVRYVPDGTFITIIRTIPSEPLNHLAANVFIENGTEISGADLLSVIKFTTRKVSNPGVSAEDLDELRELYDKEYPITENAPAIAPSDGREVAVCAYGGTTGRKLVDFLEEDTLFQPTFAHYSGALLIDADLDLTVNGHDLSDMELSHTVALLPPGNSNGFTPHLYGRALTRPTLVPVNESFNIVWTRQGFDSVNTEVKVTEPNQTPELPDTSACHKSISPATFYITSRSNREPLTNCAINVNGTDIVEAHSFTCAELQEADVKITCPGYVSFSGIIDLASTTQALIQLRDLRKIYRFELPLKSTEFGAPISFEIHSKRPISESPIEGYSLSDTIKEGAGRNNMLTFTAGTGTMSRSAMVIAAAAGFVLGAVLAMFCIPKIAGTGSKADTTAASDTAAAVQQAKPAEGALTEVKTESQQAEAPRAEATDANATASVATLVKYLDDNAVWRRDQLEAIPAAAGLFDDMNSYNFGSLSDKWGALLKESKNFAKVTNAAQQAMRKGKDPKRDKHAPTYNKADDNAINWLGYCFWIDP